MSEYSSTILICWYLIFWRLKPTSRSRNNITQAHCNYFFQFCDIFIIIGFWRCFSVSIWCVVTFIGTGVQRKQTAVSKRLSKVDQIVCRIAKYIFLPQLFCSELLRSALLCSHLRLQCFFPRFALIRFLLDIDQFFYLRQSSSFFSERFSEVFYHWKCFLTLLFYVLQNFKIRFFFFSFPFFFLFFFFLEF